MNHSRNWSKGYEAAMDEREALKPERWVSIDHAYGWISGLESIDQNWSDTMGEYQSGSKEDVKELEYLAEQSEKTTQDIKKTYALLNEVENGTNHQNTVQTLLKTIANLNEQIEDLKEA